jgi:hypothetical protein
MGAQRSPALRTERVMLGDENFAKYGQGERLSSFGQVERVT